MLAIEITQTAFEKNYNRLPTIFVYTCYRRFTMVVQGFHWFHQGNTRFTGFTLWLTAKAKE